jgi:hypothetical protein
MTPPDINQSYFAQRLGHSWASPASEHMYKPQPNLPQKEEDNDEK